VIESGDLPRTENVPRELHAPLGMVPGVPAKGWFSTRWDPREDATPSGDELVREDADGIALRAHPEVLATMDPVVRRVASTWRAAVPRELPWGVLDTAANVAIEAWHVMLGADGRKKRGRRAE